MGALYILIPIALLFLAAAVWAFLWAVDHDQFEDLEREGERILLDEPLRGGGEVADQVAREEADSQREGREQA
ncbi:MAG: cbb3-type cytochrome oxidase assembly protein CcoS [Sphingomonas sp.]|uniref:cbb3-type cytochrome oxidase assembly protein CcoS n=1 Tax=Sphingomonas sp. TaxID=28214 RepID=UPI00258287D4|nr:cbb3-type cytochrome oxidase assembly protein CcoS [Sphingomonas sp.]MCP4026647.1 cbb3-type cytochrome oxidase assembly protein CcoS [Sphingomonas sp.]